MTNLPELKGSEKQVAWAEKIRAERLPLLKEYADAAQAKLDMAYKAIDDPQFADALQQVFGGDKDAARATLSKKFPAEFRRIEAYEIALNQTSAKWWIENR